MAGKRLGRTLARASPSPARPSSSFNRDFLAPYYTLVISNPLDWLVLLAFLIVSVVATQQLHRERRRAEEARQRADEVDRLATLGAETLSVGRADQALTAITTVIREDARDRGMPNPPGVRRRRHDGNG